MGWLQRKLGWEAKDPINYPDRPENATQPYWHPVLIMLDQSIIHAFERSLPVHLAAELTKIEREFGRVTHITIVELNNDELFVNIVCRIEPHKKIQDPQTKISSAPLAPVPPVLEAPPEVRINSDGKIVEI